MREDVLGRYRLLERIGIGGMAEVFLARAADGALAGQPVVVKRMLPQLQESAESVAMFLDEARLGAQLAHPNILPVLEAGTVDGASYMILPFVDGCDLGTLEARAQRLGQRVRPAHVATILGAVARGLHAAHVATDPRTGRPLRVVHRDVSPSNVLLGRDGAIRIADFGVARSTAQSVRTTTGTIKGKLSYMSPEQVEGQGLDARADLYSLGVVLWELLVGRRLHDGRSEVQIIKAVLDEPVPRPRGLRGTIPAELDELVARCTARDPDLRPPSAAAVADVLDAFIAKTPEAGADAYRRWLDANPALFEAADPVPTTKTPRRTPSGEARPLISDEGTPVLKRVKTPSTPNQGLKLAQRGPERKRERVLYVEDEPENRDVAELRLRRSYELLLAKDDEEACRLLREEGAGLTAILMDIQLKGSKLDGIDLVRLIRGTLPDEGKPPYARDVPILDVPILFVTAYGGRYANDELLAAGAQRVVAKPVNFAELTLALVDLHLKKAVRS